MNEGDTTFSSGATVDSERTPSQESLLAAAMQERPGSMVGPYKILQLIGEGGFGSVFLAQQDRPVQRRVAIKIIKLGMDTRQVVARFEQERQALAVMDHPNIARVIDAGATETGRPYFVMELVKGEPIVDYCDQNTLTIRDRLELFVQVCVAVQHAHTKGIIHRDLKPSNILVGTQDGLPSVKVIDFGIAKATGAQIAPSTLVTEQRQMIGTPEYMSPEQALGSVDIDTRTDVYSLGVLLYELLTGGTPFGGKDFKSASHADIQRIIREVDPPVPSTRISSSLPAAGQIAARRRTQPATLGGTLRGELDWIAMKAIEKDRQRRYETALGLSMDIRRYLAGEAVLAAPPSRVYLARKFVRRHRVLVVGSAAVGAALVLGVVGTGLGLVEANRQRVAAERNAVAAKAEAERAATAEAIARSRLAEAEATVGFLDEMLGAVDPASQGKDVSVRAVLDAASGRVGAGFSDRPLVEARLRGTIGRTYTSLGVYDRAEAQLREQLRIRRDKLGMDHEDTGRAENELGSLLTRQGKFAEAEEMLKGARARHARLLGEDHPLTVQSTDLLAALFVEQMRGAEAEPLLRAVLQNRLATLGPEHVETVMSMNGLATLLNDEDRFEESEQLFESALTTQLRLGRSEHPATLETQSNLAWMEYCAAMDEWQRDRASAMRRLERARSLGEQTLEQKTRVLGEEHQSTLATMSNLASVYSQLKSDDKVEELRRKDLEITRRVLGPDHPDTAVSLANLGAHLRRRGRCAEAIPYLEESLRIARKSLPADHEGAAFTLGWYGSCLQSLGRFAESEKALLAARAVVVSRMGEQNPVADAMAKDIADLYGAWERAEPGKGHSEAAAKWQQSTRPAPPENAPK